MRDLACARCARAFRCGADEEACWCEGLPALQPVAGHWQGTLWETAGFFTQGQAALDIRLGEDGRWSGTIGRASATGIARMQHGWLVLSGTATAPNGQRQVIFYELKGDANRRWGEVVTSFLTQHASVSLRRMP